jgi:hypothetical protein
MATTLGDIRTRLAYRLAEDSAPSDTNEVARRDSFINEGYRKILNEGYWWFTKTVSQSQGVSGQEVYNLATDFRDMIELRLDRLVCEFIAESDVFAQTNYPPNYYKYGGINQRYYIFGERELHFLPVPSSTPSTLSITLTQTGGVATATSAAHGLQTGDYVLIAGADQTGYNGTVQVTSVTTNTFTYAVNASTVSPATGTITGVWQNIVYRYWKYPTALTASTDAIVIPDQFSDVLVAYALGRYAYLDDTRGNSADGFEEYNQLLKDMRVENNKRLWWSKQTPPEVHEMYE